jgi:hypothetical protein
MNAHTENRLLPGPAGDIEVAVDRPEADPLGIALIGHPHPLYGGTLDNKVAATLARAFVGAGWVAVRPNFRGVGRSAGVHDNGDGETADFLHLAHTVSAWMPAAATLPLALGGFSFGSYVAARAYREMAGGQAQPGPLVLVGTAAGKWPVPAVPAHTLVIHGEHDETIPLSAVLDWARPQDLPVTVLPGADHFFHRRLGILRGLIAAHLAAFAARK